MSGGTRILATDERPEALSSFEHWLGLKYECEFASSVGVAREKLAGEPFQLALCDVQMPGESGIGLVEEIARDHTETAIVMITGADGPELAEDAFRLGAHAYMVKPFRSGQLLVTVANALRQNRLEIAERRRHKALLGSADEKAEALKHELIEAQQQTIADLQASRQATIEHLVGAIEMHDPEADRGVTRLASTAALLGAKLGLDPDRVLFLRAAAAMHDVGQVATPDSVLQKRGPLTPCERERMEAHTTVGHEILAGSGSPLLDLAAEIALTHHEWFDGSGYPRGLSDGDISLEARIVAVADVFDALLSDRPHRPAMQTDPAMKSIEAESGTHFDPDVVKALTESLDEALALRD